MAYITATKLLTELQKRGYLESFESRRVGEKPFVETEFVVKSHTLLVSDETFGKKSMIYFRLSKAVKEEHRASMLNRLFTDINYIIADNGCHESVTISGFGRVDVRVSYFKGHRWWE